MNESLRHRLSNLQKLHGWCWSEKAEDLAAITLETKPALAVELGVFGGRAIGAIAMACQHMGTGRCVGIDPWSKGAAIEGEAGSPHEEWWSKLDLEKIYRECLTGLRQLGLETVEIMRMNDIQALPHFEDGSIDLFHSDSNHSRVVSERVTREWHRKIRVGGVVIMDDSEWETQSEAVAILKGKRDLGYELIKEIVTPEKGSYIVSRRTS